MNRAFERWAPWAVAILAVIVWVGPLQTGFYLDGQLTDIPVYRGIHDAIADGQVPYRDFLLEYPPLAGVLFWQAGVIPGAYSLGFSTLMLACLIGTALAVMATARALDTTPLRRAGAGAIVAVSPLLLGAMVQTRYDLLMTVVLGWCLWAAVTRRFTWMWVLLAVAVLVKIVPLALVPVLFVWHRHHRGTREALLGGAGAAGVVAVAMLPFVAMAPGGTWDLVGYHLDRPLQIESTGASYLLGLH
ncbi:MAG: glycosyltransferase 87 family protein, partial [Miltoncostaeaceae bacterium]